MKYALHCMSNYQSKNINNKSSHNKKSKGNFQTNNPKQGISKRFGKYEQTQIID